MIKKPKNRAIYNIGQKNFNTFKEMKAFVWYNSHTNEEIQGLKSYAPQSSALQQF